MNFLGILLAGSTRCNQTKESRDIHVPASKFSPEEPLYPSLEVLLLLLVLRTTV